ncbi:hypothetical protein [Nitrososphaera sp.]|uniref:hypothetical protein n=1 Tax=Nitrososphaera sp. TaxID=1971748 RepID=UPI00307E0CB3
MTPKKQVALMVGIFSALGIGVSVGIIAFGGGFSGGGGNIFDPPSQADIYTVGAAVTDGMELNYTVTARGESSSLADSDVSIKFDAAEGDNWLTSFYVVNGTSTVAQPVQFDIILSKELTKEGQTDASVRPYLEPIESSVMAIRDMDYGGRDKYLVVGAPWDTIFYGSSSTVVRVTSEETVQTPAGTFNAFVLSYQLQDRTSRIWVVRDLPFPVKAEVYDPSDQLLYRYELVGLQR